MSDKAKHTPEPWTAAPFDGEFERVQARGCVVAECVPQDNMSANAARIVECVNACEGMADPAAEIAALRLTVERLLAVAELNQDDIEENTGFAIESARAVLRD